MSEQVFERSVRIERSADEVFAWHERPGAFQRLAPPWQKVRVMAQHGGIRDGARVALKTYLGPLAQTWEVEHRDYEAGRQFRDVQTRGPFAAWEHLHRIEPAGDGACVLTDTIHYRLPLGPFGALGAGFVRSMLADVFAYRHRVTRADLESVNRPREAGMKRILISGASGLVGQALAARLSTAGCEVVRLLRRKAQAADEIAWDPKAGTVTWADAAPFDAVVHLAGANIAGGRWTEARKRVILQSRIQGTATLVRALAALPTERRPKVLASASAVGWYGDTGGEFARESDPSGKGFLAEVCRAWEAALEPAKAAGIRTVAVRTGVALTPAGGALAKMLPAFRAGLGGRLGDGEQGMSWISAEDLTEVYCRVIADTAIGGPVNAVAPGSVSNAEFTAVLGDVLRRPTLLPVPATVLRLALGQLGEEALLASSRVEPRVLRAAAFTFRYPQLENALRAMLGKTSES